MFLCYIDESGTSNIPGNTSHFILAGLAIPEMRLRRTIPLRDAEEITIINNRLEQNDVKRRRIMY